jgi:hypothetical protein
LICDRSYSGRSSSCVGRFSFFFFILFPLARRRLPSAYDSNSLTALRMRNQ